jgi:hypothetical protein
VLAEWVLIFTTVPPALLPTAALSRGHARATSPTATANMTGSGQPPDRLLPSQWA